jgi:hypothetical protein
MAGDELLEGLVVVVRDELVEELAVSVVGKRARSEETFELSDKVCRRRSYHLGRPVSRLAQLPKRVLHQVARWIEDFSAFRREPVGYIAFSHLTSRKWELSLQCGA